MLCRYVGFWTTQILIGSPEVYRLYERLVKLSQNGSLPLPCLLPVLQELSHEEWLGLTLVIPMVEPAAKWN